MKTLDRLNREKILLEKSSYKIINWDISTNKKCIIQFEAPELYGYTNLKLEITITDNYPFKPPNVRFIDIIPFHPNIYLNGDICLDSLKDNWTPTLTMDNLILTIFTLLIDPNPLSPANVDASKSLKTDKDNYKLECLKSMKGNDRLLVIKKMLDDKKLNELEKIENDRLKNEQKLNNNVNLYGIKTGLNIFENYSEIKDFIERTRHSKLANNLDQLEVFHMSNEKNYKMNPDQKDSNYKRTNKSDNDHSINILNKLNFKLGIEIYKDETTVKYNQSDEKHAYIHENLEHSQLDTETEEIWNNLGLTKEEYKLQVEAMNNLDLKNLEHSQLDTVTEDIWNNLGLTKEEYKLQVKAMSNFEQERKQKSERNYNNDFRTYK